MGVAKDDNLEEGVARGESPPKGFLDSEGTPLLPPNPIPTKFRPVSTKSIHKSANQTLVQSKTINKP